MGMRWLREDDLYEKKIVALKNLVSEFSNQNILI